MRARLVCCSIIAMVILALPAQGQVQQYFNDTAAKVKAANDPAEKRQILSASFTAMDKALAMVQRSSSLTGEDRAGLDRLKARVQERQDELEGLNGFERVADAQLNAYSVYVVQDMEQAETLTISVVTLLLIIIVVILLT